MKPRVTQTPKVFDHVTSAWPELLLTAQQTLGRGADLQSIVFVTQNACGIWPLSARNERGESRREAKLIKNASSPRPSPLF